LSRQRAHGARERKNLGAWLQATAEMEAAP
jgi:hypothetical protein